MTISEAARQAAVNIETIRFYERSGLLKQPLKPMSGFRRYTAEHVEEIRFIKQCQSFGFSLEEAAVLRRMLDTGDASCEPACSLAQRKLDQIRAKIEELSLLANRISGLLTAPCLGQSNQTCSVMESLRQGAAGDGAHKGRARRAAD